MEILDADGIILMSISSGIILSLLIAFSGSAWMLKNQLQANAILEERENNYLQTIKNWSNKFQILEKENKANEKLIIEANEEHDVIEYNLSNAIHEIYEIKNTEYIEIEVIEKPGFECLDVVMPDLLLECLRSSNCSS